MGEIIFVVVVLALACIYPSVEAIKKRRSKNNDENSKV